MSSYVRWSVTMVFSSIKVRVCKRDTRIPSPIYVFNLVDNSKLPFEKLLLFSGVGTLTITYHLLKQRKPPRKKKRQTGIMRNEEDSQKYDRI